MSLHGRGTVLVLALAILLLSVLPAANFAGQLFGNREPNSLGIIPSVRAQDATLPQLGIDCGLGTTLGVFTAGGTPPVTGDGVLDPTCTWSGDADALSAPDATTEPLVSDNPESLPGNGGGFSAEIRVANLNGLAINGWDISVRYDTTILNGVMFDQTGLVWTATGVMTLTPAASIDNNFAPGVGVARFAQVVLSPGPQSPDASGGLTLFRIRFDVIGVGSSQLTLFNDVLTNPGVGTCSSGCPHKSQSGALNSESFFDATGTLHWSISWMFTPNPEVPGSPLKLSATATCTGCVAALSYSWDTDSDGVADATGNPATITAPPPIVHRVILTVTDGTNTASAVKRLPLTLSIAAPASVAAGATANFNGLWLGGNPNYSGNWRLCPGSTAQKLVCSNPAPAVASTPTQTSPQAVIYNFAGVYNDTLKIGDTAVPQISTTGTTLSTFVLYTVTGTPKAYVVTVTSDIANPMIGQTVTFTATAAYPANYPAYAESADTVVNGTAPTVGTALKSDTGIKFADANANNLWDPTEWVFYCPGCTTLTATAPALYQGSGARPAVGTAIKNETPVNHFRFVGAGTTFAQGNQVIYDVNADNLFDASFSYAFRFGDGASANVVGGFSATATHSYSTAGTFPVTVNVQETGTAATSKIKETGTMSIVVGAVAFDFSLGAPSPGTLTVVQGSTSPTSMITATFVSGTTTQVTFSAPSLPTGVAAIFTNNPCSPTCTVTVSFSATAIATLGTTTVAIDAAGGGASHSTSISLTVTTTGAPLTVDFAPKRTIVGNTTFVPLITGGTPAFTCTWDFGDGTPTSTTCLVTHNYENPGTFNVSLTVTDSSGKTANTLSPVRVQMAPRISGQSVQRRILPDQTENIIVTVKNFSSLSVDVTLSVQIFNITDHTDTLVTTLTRSFTVGPSSSMTVTLQFKPAAVVADYRDIAMISYSHSFGDLNGDGTPETVTGTSPFQSRRGFSVVSPSIVGQTVQAEILPGQTETFTIKIRNPAPVKVNVILTIQIFNITRHANTLVTTLTKSFAIGPRSTMSVSLSWTPPAVTADYRDVAQISGNSFQSRRGFSVVPD